MQKHKHAALISYLWCWRRASCRLFLLQDVWWCFQMWSGPAEIVSNKTWENTHAYKFLMCVFFFLLERFLELFFDMTSHHFCKVIFTGLTAGEVSSGSRIRMASGLFSLQNLRNHIEITTQNRNANDVWWGTQKGNIFFYFKRNVQQSNGHSLIHAYRLFKKELVLISMVLEEETVTLAACKGSCRTRWLLPGPPILRHTAEHRWSHLVLKDLSLATSVHLSASFHPAPPTHSLVWPCWESPNRREHMYIDKNHLHYVQLNSDYVKHSAWIHIYLHRVVHSHQPPPKCC